MNEFDFFRSYCFHFLLYTEREGVEFLFINRSILIGCQLEW